MSTKIIYQKIREYYGDVKCALYYENPLQLLIATILSAQCTDERVNIVTKVLFKRYSNVYDLASADISELKIIIRSTGFYNNKAKSIIGASKLIVDEFNGEVPKTMEELLLLPGVARKTANVVLWNSFGVNSGFCVDTHVYRLAQRTGFSRSKDVKQVEKDLMRRIPTEDWGKMSLRFIAHGRKTCKARSPDCGNCFLNKICPSAYKFTKKYE